ncbi:MAG: M20/M25/M40 family metallo-hydrolase [Nitrososphaerota archaeon]|nr:M20/M25/M40 family metallo-hydrolase [Nitrososphaerota archaeon]MDG6931502.1 M20/M25/M40 family metallo-hydrolase [Nitrososphaerota archaeon]MDG6936393.1 M20/M25/M40 family metallo-hydrolase [Nitrososphaerota archaeon]MDG6944752.1 M20/M25/M40 family metallo-hydrolase [Nitrososphaerota archaeon]
MEKDPVKFLTGLIKVYSPSTKEKAASDYILDYIRSVGGYQDVRQDNSNNVITRISTGKPEVFLVGHMDTVPGELPVVNDGKSIYGRGAVDAKTSLAALLHAALELADVGCGLVFAAVTDEERASEGMNGLLKGGARPDFAVFGEPTGLSSVAISYKGRLLARLEYSAPSYHSSSPWLGKTAFDLMWEDVERIKGEARSLNEGAKSNFDSITAQVVKCDCGDSLNKTPARATMHMDVRFPPGLSSQELEERLFTAEHSIEDRLEPFSTPPSSILSRSFYHGIFKVLGRKPNYVKKMGTCDGNVLKSYYDVPIVAYGAGDSKLSHTELERVTTEDFLRSIEVIKESVRFLCQSKLS